MNIEKQEAYWYSEFLKHNTTCQPEQAQKQEPVAFRNKDTGEFCSGGFLLKHGARWTPLYASPPQRQPQSPAEAGELWKVGMTPHEFTQAIEAAHGIKE